MLILSKEAYPFWNVVAAELSRLVKYAGDARSRGY